MQFNESGLPASKIIEAAFYYSQNYLKEKAVQVGEEMSQETRRNFQRQIKALQKAADRSGDPATIEKINKQIDMFEKMCEQTLKSIPGTLAIELKNKFNIGCVGAAKELINHAEKSSDTLVAAVLLLDCVEPSSIADHIAITDKFGEEVADIIADISHVEAHPTKRAENIAALSDDSKRVLLAQNIAGIHSTSKTIKESLVQIFNQEGLPEEIKDMILGSVVAQIPPGMIEGVFEQVKLLYGNDKKLDARVILTFNEMMATLKKDTRIVNNNGVLQLTEGNIPPGNDNQSPAAKKQKGPIPGGKVF